MAAASETMQDGDGAIAAAVSSRACCTHGRDDGVFRAWCSAEHTSKRLVRAGDLH